MEKVYKNSTELMQLGGASLHTSDLVDACLRGRLNLFLIGDTGSGKTQLARDAMSYFGDKSLFILGRNDMDTRELFQQVNPEFLKAIKEGSTDPVQLKGLTDKINYHLIVVDELPNCVPAVRAQLFNLFDGFIEVDGKAYPIGQNYSVGIATGNVGQKFTESSNDLGRALKDRMHVIVDVDYFHPTPYDTLEILAGNTNPRVEFYNSAEDKSKEIIAKSKSIASRDVPFEKLIVANYLVHGLDYCEQGSKRRMKDAWPNQLESHEQGSDVGLVLPLSMRAAKSVLRLSESLDDIVREKGAEKISSFGSMMQAFKFVSAYSGVLNEAAVQNAYGGNNYDAIDAVIATTRTQFKEQRDSIAAGLEMIDRGKLYDQVLSKFGGRWSFMKDLLANLAQRKKVD